MGNAFGTKKTLKEQMRENKRTITRAIRELDRERTNLQNQEKKLVLDIKKMAKEGQMVRTPPEYKFVDNHRVGIGEDYGKGFSSHQSICNEILHDAVSIASSVVASRGRALRQCNSHSRIILMTHVDC